MSKQSYINYSVPLRLSSIAQFLFISFLLFASAHIHTSNSFSQLLLPLSFFDLANFERVSIQCADIARNAPQYQALVDKFVQEAKHFFIPDYFKSMQDGKQAKDQFLSFMRLPEFQLFLSTLLLKKLPLRQLDTQFLLKEYFPVRFEKITLGMHTPQSYAIQYQESQLTKTNTQFALKYKKIAENIIATVGTIHKGIKKNIRDDQTKKTNIWNKSERAYYRALLAMNGTSNNKNASLLFGRAIKLLLLSERQTFWAHVLSCINNCLQIHGQDEKKIEELKQLFNNIQGSLQLLPASLCNYIVYILTSSFHVINDDKTIQFFISALHTILDRKPFYPDERELIQMLVVRLYNHNKQYTDALAYLKNILNEHEWTDGNKFTVELIKFDLLENLEG